MSPSHLSVSRGREGLGAAAGQRTSPQSHTSEVRRLAAAASHGRAGNQSVLREQSIIWIPLSTAVIDGVVIFVTAFLMGILVRHYWRR